MSDLGRDVRRGIAWTTLNRITIRVSSFALGIVLARILAPDEFGVYAIALTVQVIVINLAELGLAADLVRNGDFARRAPTIATLAVISAAALTAVMVATAPWVSATMGTGEATPVVRLMSVTILLAGISAVPYARLQRDFRQRSLFAIDLTTLVVSTALTLGLALMGAGAMSLAIGRVVAQVVATVCQFRAAGETVRFGWCGDVARSGLRFGFPFACAGLVSLTLLNVDNMLVGHTAGAGALGIYVLAFNMASWPSTVIGSSIRAVAMPAFALVRDDVEVLARSSGLAWALAVPMAASLGLLARPLVDVVYGVTWTAAAGPLAGLAILGGLRVVFEVQIAFLTARGASGALLRIQATWLAVLVPALWVAVRQEGLTGVGWTHAAVAGVVMIPVHLHGVVRAGARWRPVLSAARAPIGAIAVAAPLALVAITAMDRRGAPDLLVLLVGGVVLTASYGLLLRRWLTGQLAWFRTLTAREDASAESHVPRKEETIR